MEGHYHVAMTRRGFFWFGDFVHISRKSYFLQPNPLVPEQGNIWLETGEENGGAAWFNYAYIPQNLSSWYRIYGIVLDNTTPLNFLKRLESLRFDSCLREWKGERRSGGVKWGELILFMDDGIPSKRNHGAVFCFIHFSHPASPHPQHQRKSSRWAIFQS